jgi:hypothetical protein
MARHGFLSHFAMASWIGYEDSAGMRFRFMGINPQDTGAVTRLAARQAMAVTSAFNFSRVLASGLALSIYLIHKLALTMETQGQGLSRSARPRARRLSFPDAADPVIPIGALPCRLSAEKVTGVACWENCWHCWPVPSSRRSLDWDTWASFC